MPLSGNAVLVTGGAGFVGANLVRRLLAEGAHVHVIVRPQTDTWRLDDVRAALRWHAADLTEARRVSEIVRAVRPDVIFHLAKHRGDPVGMDYSAAYSANVHATLALLEAAHAHGVRRFVHSGSSLEYDLTRSPLREADPGVPLSVHGVTKAAASILVQHFARRHGLPAVVLRLFTVYGPWEGHSRFVPRGVMAALTSQPLAVTDPRLCLSHDWIHVDDVVEACVASVSAPDVAGEIINIATGTATSNDEVLSAIERASGARITRDTQPFPARAWDTAVWVADVAKARERLRWSATRDLQGGIAHTVDWFRAHSHLYRATAASHR
jgi:nucleoside-diphosphate-sugar epimerase